MNKEEDMEKKKQFLWTVQQFLGPLNNCENYK